MTEPRFRICAKSGGWPTRWLAFGPRKELILVDDPARAYEASAASIEQILRQRGRVLGHCDLAPERVGDPVVALRAYRMEHHAGRTRKMYLSLGRDGRARLTPYKFEALVGVEADLRRAADAFFVRPYTVEEVA